VRETGRGAGRRTDTRAEQQRERGERGSGSRTRGQNGEERGSEQDRVADTRKTER